ncbi:hypothetical protein [Microbispora bryophytorum]|uniref:hypothetical protein n=1 Tax=Microbispora bryophytorum TaxID=1460882 RepID=UPI0033EE4A8C
MRLVDITRAWTKLNKSELATSFPLSIEIHPEQGIPEEITLPSPLTLIFGLNGAGKSRLLRGVSGSTLGGKVVSLHELINYLVNEFGARDDILELLEENGPLSPEKVMHSAVQDLVRRDYEEVIWYAIPIVDSPFSSIVGDEVVPAFVVQHAGSRYDFRTMGLGELSAHLLLWILSYTRESDDGLLLLDEPEAFMPPPSRHVVLSHLLEATLKRKKPLVVASHSLELIQPALDSGSALLLAESRNIASLVGPSEELADRVAGLFGQVTPVEWLIICEDESAFIFGRELLRRADARLWQSTRFLWCKGFGDLLTIWKHLPRPSRLPEGLIQFMFLADGDKAPEVERAIAATQKASHPAPSQKWPFICLPDDPDVMMKQAAEENIALLSERLNMTEARLRGRFEALRGREAHNWVEDVLKEAASVGVERQNCLNALALSAVASAEANGTIAQFRSALHACLMEDPSPGNAAAGS